MADRTVKVTLRANVADFNQQIKQASRTLDEAAKSADKTGKAADTGLGRMAQRAQLMSGELTTAGTAMAAFGTGLLAASTVAVKASADFAEAMAIVQADTHESAESMEQLRAAAIQAGKDTAFSAVEAADGIDQLAKAGVSTADILGGGLSGALDLAAAGGVSVGEAAETAASAMVQFGLAGSDVTHVADLLAAGAGKAQGGVSDLSQALAQGGLVASQMGLSIEETVGGLAAFASAGLLGSDAGTSFKTMLQRLMNPATKAKNLMKDLGLQVYDSQGHFVGLANFAGQLQEKLGALSEAERNTALSTMFGSDAIRAAAVLYKQGEEGIQGWIDAVNDQGYAAETASARLDSLKGDLQIFAGSWETMLIGMGEGAQGPLRSVVQSATDAVNAFAELPAPVQQSVTVIAGVAGAALTAAGGAMVLLPRIVETRTAMQSLGISAGSAASAVKNLFTSTSLGGRVGRMGLTAGLIIATGSTDKFKTSVTEAGNALAQLDITGASAATAFKDYTGAATLSASQFGAMLNDTAGGMSNWEKGLTGFASAMDKAASHVGWDTRSDFQKFADDLAAIDDAMSAMDSSAAVDSFRRLAEMTDGSDKALTDLLDSLPGYKQALTALATEAGMAADDQTLLAIAMGDLDPAAVGAGAAARAAGDDVAAMGTAASEAAEELAELIDALSDMAQLVLAERDAARGLEQAIDDATETIAENGRTLDRNTESGRANEAALDAIASSTWKLVEAMYGQNASTEEMQEAMQHGRDALIAAAQAAGMTAEEAEALADELRLIPENITTDVTMDASEAELTLAQLMGQVADSEGNITIGASRVPADKTLSELIGLVDNSDGTITINGNDGPARLKKDSVKIAIDKTTGTVTITGKDNASGKLRTIKATLDSIRSKTVTVTTNYVSIGSSNKALQAGVNRLAGYASGGAVRGPGTATSDSVPAMLSAGEHVWTAAEVGAVGGQARMLQLRALARQGLLSREVMGFADGGSPSVYGAAPPAIRVNAAAPTAALTVVVDNPITGEQLRQEMTTVADGRIVRANRLNR
ncbi:phage tail tape measure protein [Actinomyces procaprae]|uniref:phage tail tape measure protein n=1 Tax=Actinomyces procaprae TaxID=2560010 RepID=UPI0010A250C0|nr:phage tail tape measure protein [Actinomyces procaprae]